MNLYLISQSQNNDWGTYDSLVVAAETAQDAALITPNSFGFNHNYWCSAVEHVEVKLIGVAKEGTAAGEIIISSFNAG